MHEIKPLRFPDGMDRFRDVLIHDAADKELRSIYSNKLSALQAAKLAANLNKRFRYLVTNMGHEYEYNTWFEILKGVTPSMRSTRVKMPAPIDNLRLIYVIHENYAIILASFIEHGKEDYRRGILSAQKRYRDIFS